MAYELTAADFTTAVDVNSKVDGTGVFDTVMNSVRAQVYAEYKDQRITGQEYSTVYLGALEKALATALQFLLEKDKVALEAELIRLQGENLLIEKDKTLAEIRLIEAQIDKMDRDRDLVLAQIEQMGYENTKIQSETILVNNKAANEILQGGVIEATECKLKAEFDVLVEQRAKVAAETALLNQKKVTEAAQVSGAAVDEDSVIGKQKSLYAAQTDGFKRDAEQKATKIMVDTWNVRRTTDEALQGGPAGLDDLDVSSAVTIMLDGIRGG